MYGTNFSFFSSARGGVVKKIDLIIEVKYAYIHIITVFALSDHPYIETPCALSIRLIPRICHIWIYVG